MPVDKREIPLLVLEALERINRSDSELFRIVEKEGRIARLEDNHPNPNQYFEFVSFQNNELSLAIKPRNEKNPIGCRINIKVEHVDAYFDKWLKCLVRYERSTIFDDPILERYTEEAFNEFHLVDEDADTNSYDLQTQLLIDHFLANSIYNLKQFDESNEEVKSIKNDIEDLRGQQTQLTKKQVVTRLAKIFAKARKFSLVLLGELYVEAKKELFKTLITSGFEVLK